MTQDEKQNNLKNKFKKGEKTCRRGVTTEDFYLKRMKEIIHVGALLKTFT